MTNKNPGIHLQAADSTGRKDGMLWPGENYHQQVDNLKQHIGKTIYLCEIKVTEINAAVHHTDHKYRLLAVIDYPQPDPKANLYPHNILLDDGRGINLGRIASISIEQAFNPAPHNILYQDRHLINSLLPGKFRVTPRSIQQTSKRVLENILGCQNRPRLAGDHRQKKHKWEQN